MNRMIAALVAAGFAASAQADMVASNASGDELRLREKPCAIASVLAAIKDEHRDKFRDGQATIGGKTIRLCWVDTQEGYYWLLPEGAQDGIAYSVTIFISQPGV
jgi:hypothetical protein